MNRIFAVVLAAGQGKRLGGEADAPKVMRLLSGKPLLQYVLDSLCFIPNEHITVVVGYKKELVALPPGCRTVTQEERLGTAHAVLCAERLFDGLDCELLVCCGDAPMFRQSTFEDAIDSHRRSGAACTLLSAIVDNGSPEYGRVIRGSDGLFAGIIEYKDCSPEQRAVPEMNAGVYIAKSQLLFDYCRRVGNGNAQSEYYLTDVPGLLLKDGHTVNIYTIEDSQELTGVNRPEDLKLCESILATRNDRK